MLELRFTPIAVNDLQKIQQFIAEDSVAMAEKVIQEFFKQFEVLIDFPYMGMHWQSVCHFARIIDIS